MASTITPKLLLIVCNLFLSFWLREVNQQKHKKQKKQNNKPLTERGIKQNYVSIDDLNGKKEVAAKKSTKAVLPKCLGVRVQSLK